MCTHQGHGLIALMPTSSSQTVICDVASLIDSESLIDIPHCALSKLATPRSGTAMSRIPYIQPNHYMGKLKYLNLQRIGELHFITLSMV